jgi:coenzyme F420-reducing hydrogenase beta subunit
MVREDINIIKDNQLCYSCGLCNTVCPKDAISMRFNSIGQLLPVIDEDLCINCGICYTNCPGYDSKKLLQNGAHDSIDGNVLNVYVGRSTDDKIFKNSQSGGAVTAILAYLFKNNLIDAAVVCGVEYDVDYNARAVVVTNSDDLIKYQKSSYTPVDMLSALKATICYKSIAIVGTGCHIQGALALKSFNGNKYGNIKYLLGLICDRTMCRTATDVLYGNFFKGEKKKIVWRDKSLDYKQAALYLENENGDKKELPSWQRHALKEPFTAPRCRICFDKLNINADITLGDPWGMSNVDWKNGASLIITRSATGADVINSMLEYKELDAASGSIEEVFTGQGINAKLKNIKKFIAIYKRHKWMLPTYYEDCDTALIDDKTLIAAERIVNEFIKMSSETKSKIIKKYRFVLRKMNFNIKVFSVLLKFVHKK